MMYPYRDDSPCPYCKKGTMKWRAQFFASTYQLGRMFCDNPECPESEESMAGFIMKIAKEAEGGITERRREKQVSVRDMQRETLRVERL